MTEHGSKKSSGLLISNYCVSFINLLGQRVSLRNSTLIPSFRTKIEEDQFRKTIVESAGAIANLQERSKNLLDAARSVHTESELRSQLPEELPPRWDQIAKSKVKTQRWSDGLVSFANLGDHEVSCHVNDVYFLLVSAGLLCFMGLSSRRPLRGAIEIAWGVELHPGELYGAAIARAYELESETAQYPRIVLGPELKRYLDSHSMSSESDAFSTNDRELAKLCLRFISPDEDGHWIVNYLCESFRELITQDQHAALYDRAALYVREQLTSHQESRNSRLAFRYAQLLSYFLHYAPSAP